MVREEAIRYRAMIERFNFLGCDRAQASPNRDHDKVAWIGK